MSALREWQVAEGSATAHVIDTARPAPKRSGARSLCGRYPQRNAFPWFGLGVDEPDVLQVLSRYRVRVCDDCRDRLIPDPATPTRAETPADRQETSDE